MQLLELTDFDVRFYLGQIILALEYLHEKQIIYRNLKPSNIWLADDVYCLLISFQFQGYIQLLLPVQIKYLINHRTYTIVGTLDYMSPECMIGQGYSYSADLYSLGIVLYELYLGDVPFKVHDFEQDKIIQKINNSEIFFPDYFQNKTAKQLILQLLSYQGECRLGGSYANLKKNQFFKNFDWDALETKKLLPPIMPDNIKHPGIILTDEQINQIYQKNENLSIANQIKTNQKYFRNEKEIQNQYGLFWDEDF